MEAATRGLEALDLWFTDKGQPEKLHTDWDADLTFTPTSTGFSVDAATLEKDMKKLSGL